MRVEHWLYAIPLRLRSLFRRKKVDAELEEELQFHLQSQIELQRAKGLSPEDARYAAMRVTGGIAQIQEECRDMRKLNVWENLLQDLRYTARTFAKSPAFTVTAILSLALGIGANTTIFSLINAVQLRTLPVDRPDQLVTFTPISRDGKAGSGFSYPAFLLLRSGAEAFSGITGASSLRRVEVGAEPAVARIVTGSYFNVLGVRPALGRVFQDQDDALPVAVLSFRYWTNNFNAAPSVLGKQLNIDGTQVTVVGVAPAGFFGETVGESSDLWTSVNFEPAQRRNERGFVWLNLIARLMPGRTPQQAAAQLSVVAQRDGGEMGARIAADPGGAGFSPLRERYSESLRILMCVVAVVLLIACANLASLLLSRAAVRQREIATRLAIGAGKGRIVRQLLTESLLLSLAGGALGVLFAFWSSQALVRMIPAGRIPVALDLRPDLRILLFTAAVSLLAGLVFGLVPALQAVRRDVSAALKSGPRSADSGIRHGTLKDALIAAQVALSLLLLVTGGLFLQTLRNLRGQDTGYRTAQVLNVELGAQRGYRPEWPTLIAQLLERTRALPGVQSATVSYFGILSDAGGGVGGLKVDSYTPATTEDSRARADWVGPAYFETAGIPLLEGREFTMSDNPGARKVIIVNQTLARHFFGNRTPVGRQIEFNKDAYEIIGLAKDAKYIDLRAPSPRVLYFSAMQRRGGVNAVSVRTAGSPAAFAGAMRAVVREIDPRLRIGEVATVSSQIDRKLSREYLMARLSGFFGGLTLLLVSIGIYGTLAYAVAQRTKEIGIRMALGAAPGSVLRMVLRDILYRLAAGLLLGVAAVYASAHLLAAMLFGLKPTDPANIAIAAAILLAVALAAGYLPARRAAKVDPLTALRFE